MYHGEKFNVETEIVAFTEQEFNSLAEKPENVDFRTAKRIFELLEKFNLNFVVVHDRMEDSIYSIEDLKNVRTI